MSLVELCLSSYKTYSEMLITITAEATYLPGTTIRWRALADQQIIRY